MFWSLEFRTVPAGIIWADGDGLENTQETGGANGHAPAKSLSVQEKFAAKVTEEPFHAQSPYCL